jgi:hypothetical protein
VSLAVAAIRRNRADQVGQVFFDASHTGIALGGEFANLGDECANLADQLVVILVDSAKR